LAGTHSIHFGSPFFCSWLCCLLFLLASLLRALPRSFLLLLRQLGSVMPRATTRQPSTPPSRPLLWHLLDTLLSTTDVPPLSQRLPQLGSVRTYGNLLKQSYDTLSVRPGSQATLSRSAAVSAADAADEIPETLPQHTHTHTHTHTTVRAVEPACSKGQYMAVSSLRQRRYDADGGGMMARRTGARVALPPVLTTNHQ
jgi:hypothetical protein